MACLKLIEVAEILSSLQKANKLLLTDPLEQAMVENMQ
jgi:hypothetical protein